MLAVEIFTGKEGTSVQKLMIAECSEVYIRALEAELAGQYQIQSCCDGDTALALLQEFQPDILILHLSLPNMDGITLLQRSPFRPAIILAITNYLSRYVAYSIGEMGIDYTMISPSIPSICMRLKDLVEHYSRQPAGTDPQSILSHHLHMLGIPAHRDGYRQLLAAIPLYAKDPQQFMTKELYPKVARICGSRDGRSVEHSMRKVVHAAWEHRDNAVWRKYFLPGPRGSIPCPSNKEFICRMAEFLDPGSF